MTRVDDDDIEQSAAATTAVTAALLTDTQADKHTAVLDLPRSTD